MKNKKPQEEHTEPVTADQIQKTVQDAKTLAAIPDQKLLENPALNPATRAKYDQLTAERLEAALEADHRRKLAEADEQARVAEEAARVAEVIDQARRATSPARTILDMTRHQVRFGRISLGASLALSVGSAIGLAAAVVDYGGPAPVGYLAEVGLTGLSTAVIVWRGILARAGTTLDKNTQWLFAALVVVPLLVSILGSTVGAGPVGAACSIGSALFAGLTYLINTSASSAIGQAITKIDRTETAQERPTERPAQTEPDRESAPAEETPGESGDGLDVVADSLADQAAHYLRSHGQPSERSHESGRSHEETEEPNEAPPAQANPSDPSERPLTAQERRRLQGRQNRARVARYLDSTPDATAAEIAEALGLGESTVRRIRRELDEGGAS